MPAKKGKIRPERTYTLEDKIGAAVLYANEGTIKGTARKSSIPESTIRYWVNEDQQFRDLIDKSRNELADELIGKWQGVIEKAIEVYAEKASTMTAKEAVIAAAVAQDKQRTLQALPAQYSAKSPEAERLDKLADQIRSLGKKPISDPKAVH